MNTTVSINLAGRSFFIDEDAYHRLKTYMEKLNTWFRNKEGGQEIIHDIENRFAELFELKIKPETAVITLKMVDEAIVIMGQPEDFEEGDKESDPATKADPFVNFHSKRLYRDLDNRVLGGVCSGVAAYFHLDPVLVRVLFVLFSLIGVGTGLLIYAILWIALPPALTPSQKLEMKGEHINVSNIEKKVRNTEDYRKQEEHQPEGSANPPSGTSFLGKMNQQDRTIAIVAICIGGSLLLGKLLSMSGWFFQGPLHFISQVPGATFGIPFAGLFIVFFPIALILFIIGLAGKNLMKPMLITILVLLLLFISLKIIPAIIHSFHFLL